MNGNKHYQRSDNCSNCGKPAKDGWLCRRCYFWFCNDCLKKCVVCRCLFCGKCYPNHSDEDADDDYYLEF